MTKPLSILSLTIDCVQPVTKRLSTPLWRSIVSKQWPSVSVPALWQSAMYNQWPHVSVSLSDDRLCPVTKRLSAPLWRSDVSSQWQNVSILLLWRSTVAIFYWLSFGTKPLSVTVADIQWRIWRNGWHYLKRPLCKGQGHSFGTNQFFIYDFLQAVNSNFCSSTHRLTTIHTSQPVGRIIALVRSDKASFVQVSWPNAWMSFYYNSGLL